MWITLEQKGGEGQEALLDQSLLDFNRENWGGGKHLKTGWPMVGEGRGSFSAR